MASTPRHWRKGERPTAARLNRMQQDALPVLAGGGKARVIRTGGRAAVQVDPGQRVRETPTRRFKIHAIQDDYLECYPWYAEADGGSGVLVETVVYVAKPKHLRGGVTVYPAYEVGQEIVADWGLIGGTGCYVAALADFARWEDCNHDGRDTTPAPGEDYDPGESYAPGTVINYGDTLWIALIQTTAGHDPPSYPGEWGMIGHAPVTLDAGGIDEVIQLDEQELSFYSQVANSVFAGPTVGGADEPTFRALVADDIPDLSALYTPPHDLLCLDEHLDTAAAACTTGAIIYGSDAETPLWTPLAPEDDDDILTLDGGLPTWKPPVVHALDDAAHHSGADISEDYFFIADADGMPVQSTNTDTEVAAAVALSPYSKWK